MKVVLPSQNHVIFSALRRGKIIAYPTETSYGLGCLLSKYEAKKRIFTIKQRPFNQEFIILVRDIAMAKKYAQWDQKVQLIASHFWPGHLTLILPSKQMKKKVAIRVSSHPFLQKLFVFLKEPLISTSLNTHGKSNCYSLSGCKKQFDDEDIDLFIDAGILPRKKSSLILDMTKKDPKIIRASKKVFNEQVSEFLTRI